ncbi:MAG TPA: STAS domain-containing protein [Azospirillum sp.]|nr:STAS domain-containing protein [Azospirillum sp.]
MTMEPRSRRACLIALGALGAGVLGAGLAPPAWALSVMPMNVANVLVLTLNGKLIIGEGEFALRQAVQQALNSGAQRIVVDLRGVTAIDSTGVGELVSSYTTATNRGARMVLANLPTRINDVLHITQLITVFDVYDSVDAAVGALRT